MSILHSLSLKGEYRVSIYFRFPFRQQVTHFHKNMDRPLGNERGGYRGNRNNGSYSNNDYHHREDQNRDLRGHDDRRQHYRNESPRRNDRHHPYGERERRTGHKTRIFLQQGSSFRPLNQLDPHFEGTERNTERTEGSMRNYQYPTKLIMNYSESELRKRKNQFGSTLSIFDREKFEDEFDHDSLPLNKEDREVYNENPHIRQVFANERKFIRLGREMKEEDRYVTQDSSTWAREPYCRRQGEAKTVDHWGQRKLLMSEIEFISLYGQIGSTIVYAGAAPGTHIKFMSEELFPDCKFVLVDPADFDVKPTERIEVIQDFYTDELANKYSKKNGYDKLLFVSDIRSMSAEMTDKEKEERVIIDMKCQEDWHNLMEPNATMLKFRLPYHQGKTMYLKGRIFFPIWGGRTTTETRLVATTNERHEYDNIEYEELMFHHNTTVRTQYYDHDIKGEGLDHCFDCASEIFVLGQYFRKFRKDIEEDKIDEEISNLSRHISVVISNTGRSLKQRDHMDRKRRMQLVTKVEKEEEQKDEKHNDEEEQRKEKRRKRFGDDTANLHL
eukprot:TRINITY_DN5650_c0_g1_i3.p1 TRINITY_DN5650_c0_g1~~TRINITY_DN5650_c0_g1_i3.p1  ORF type:complete len:557 (+),score=125.51 TRINITY_DN5650_c0_g1_i3:342-2012(+)